MNPPPAVALLIDSRASVVSLPTTVRQLVRSSGYGRVLVDPSTPAGLAVALDLLRDPGVSLEPIGFEGAPTGPVEGIEGERRIIDPSEITDLEADLVVVPAMIGSHQDYIDAMAENVGIDFSATTLPGLVVEMAMASGRSLSMIDTPERGLVQEPDGSFRRRILHIGEMVGPEE